MMHHAGDTARDRKHNQDRGTVQSVLTGSHDNMSVHSWYCRFNDTQRC
jgi:hypothetical protein